CFLFSMLSALSYGECQLQYSEGDLVVQVETPAGRQHPPVDTLDEPGALQAGKLTFEPGRSGRAVDGPETPHPRLGRRRARGELPSVRARPRRGRHALPR